MKKALLLLMVLLGFNLTYAQVCAPNHNNTCDVGQLIDSLQITGTPFAPVMPVVCNGVSYQFGNAANEVMNLTAGATYTVYFKGASTSPLLASLWIDYNQNSTYEPSEWTDLGRNVTTNSQNSVTFIVPSFAATGNTTARLRTRLTGNANAAIDACTQFGSGVTYDFAANIVAAPLCTGAPAVPVLNATSISLCAGDSVTVNYTNPAATSGISLNWEVSTDGGNTWATAPGSTSTSYSYLVKQSVWGNGPALLRLTATCSAGGSVSSATVPYGIKPANQCYCIANLHANTCTPTYLLTNVTATPGTFAPAFPTACNGTYYPFTGSTANDTLRINPGQTVTFNFTIGVASIGSLFIDYNQNGVFEASEWTDLGRALTANTANSVQITVPVTALSGVTMARIRTRTTGTQNGATDACLNFGSGLTIDFPVKVGVLPGCTAAPAVPAITASKAKLCGTDVSNLNYTNFPGVSGLTYLWEVSTNAGNTWNPAPGANSSANFSIVGASLPALANWFRVTVACAASGSPVVSNTVTVDKQPVDSCLCLTNLHNNTCTVDGLVTAITAYNSTFRPTTLPTACASPSAVYYTLTGTTVADTLIAERGAQVDFNTTLGTASSTNTYNGSLWIDYNQDGTFATDEYYDLGRSLTVLTPNAFAFYTSQTANVGVTRARLRIRLTGNNNGPGDACLQFGSGSTYDFPVKMLQTVGLADGFLQRNLRVYPNPTKGAVTVTMPAQNGAVKFTLTDLSGRTVGNINPTYVSADRFELPLQVTAGTYILNVVTNSGVAHQKLVVE